MSEKKTKAYYRVNEFQQSVLDKRNETFERGFELGFESAKKYINLKKKFVSTYFASPFSGKTAFTFDTHIYIAKKYGAKFALFSPEGGGKEAVVSYLVQVYLGKKLHGHNAQTATDEEWLEALDFIDRHFIILSPIVVGSGSIEFTTREMFSQVHNAMKEYGWEIDIILIDTHAMLKKDDNEKKLSIADYILDNLYYMNHVAQSMNVHIQIIMHSADETTIVDKDTNIEYIPKTHPNRIANGKNVYRTSQLLMGIWRTPAGVVEKSVGVPYPENRSDFHVCKNKIFGAGTTGVFSLYYDDDKQRFYEIIAGKKYYCGEYEQQNANPTKSITPNKLF